MDNYLTLGLRSSAITVNNSANAICTTAACYNRMSSYISYLRTCQVGSIVDYFDDDDDDDDDDVCYVMYLAIHCKHILLCTIHQCLDTYTVK